LKEFNKNLLKKEFKRIQKKLLTRFKPSDILRKSLKGDNIKQKITAKVVRKKNGL